MPDSDHSLDILIRTEADTKGVEAVDQELRKLIQTTGKDTQEQKESTKQTKDNREAKQELKKALGELAQASPLAGAAMKAAFSPIGAAISVALVALQYYRREIESLAESTKTSDFEKFEGAMENAAAALQKADMEASAFNRSLIAAGESADTVTARMERLSQVQQVLLSQEEKIANAKKGNELAQAGLIQDPVARAMKVLEIEQRSAAEAKKRADDSQRDALMKKEWSLLAERSQEKGLIQAVTTARERMNGLGAPDSVEKKLEFEKARLASIDADIKKYEEQVDKDKAGNWSTAGLPFGQFLSPEAAAIKNRAATLDSLYEQRLAQQTILGQLGAQAPVHAESTAQAADALKTAEAALAAAQGRIRQLNSELEVSRRTTAIEAGARSVIAPIESSTRQTKTAVEIHQFAAQVLGNEQAAIDLFAKYHGNLQLIASDLARLRQRIEQFGNWNRTNGLNAGGQ